MGEHGEPKEHFEAHELADAIRLIGVGRRMHDEVTIQAAIQKAIRWATKAGKSITDPDIAEALGFGKMDHPSDED